LQTFSRSSQAIRSNGVWILLETNAQQQSEKSKIRPKYFHLGRNVIPRPGPALSTWAPAKITGEIFGKNLIIVAMKELISGLQSSEFVYPAVPV